MVVPNGLHVAITGAAGFVGRRVVEKLSGDRGALGRIVALDRAEVPAAARREGVEYLVADVRSPDLGSIFRERGVGSVVHLAAIVTPPPGATEDLQFSVDVLGTKNVLEACAAAGVGHLVVTSSAAAYGYHADNPEWLSETDALRGNEEFAYSRNKRLVEDLLARWRASRPALRQLIFRPGTILGPGARNQITDLFEKPVILGIRGSATPFVFISDDDVAECIARGVRERREGIFNLTADGMMTLRDIAVRTRKRFVPLPAGLVRAALRVLRGLGLTQYGPEQVDFLRYRPVIQNRRLKEDFGYVPRLDARRVFEAYLEGRERACA